MRLDIREPGEAFFKPRTTEASDAGPICFIKTRLEDIWDIELTTDIYVGLSYLEGELLRLQDIHAAEQHHRVCIGTRHAADIDH